MSTEKKSKRGFAAMTYEQRAAIASKGGRTAHEKGTAHEWDSAAAKAAGAIGGKAAAAIPGHMSEIGAKGGAKRAANFLARRRAMAAAKEPT